jgi:hypothetical protein
MAALGPERGGDASRFGCGSGIVGANWDSAGCRVLADGQFDRGPGAALPGLLSCDGVLGGPRLRQSLGQADESRG